MIPDVLLRLWRRWRHRHHADDLQEELRVHRAMTEEALERAGESPSDARGLAQRVLGNDLQASEDSRAVWIAPFFDQLQRDVRLAFRQIRRAPAFSAAAIGMTALCTAAVTMVVSVFNLLFVAPLPYPGVDRILAAVVGGAVVGGATGMEGAVYDAVRERGEPFEAVAALSGGAGWNLVVGEHAEYVDGLRVSEQYFDVLGVRPRLGRGFTAAEDMPGGPEVVVIAHHVWQRALGGRPDVIGQMVSLGGTPHEVVGVMPDGFHSALAGDVWTPLRLKPDDWSINYMVTARLRPGASMADATAALDLARADLLARIVTEQSGRLSALRWVPLQRALGQPLTVPLLVLAAAIVGIVLVACANLAGLQLLRTMARRHEVATRLAIGGSTGRIVQQLLAEAFVLAAIGGVVGIGLVVVLLPVVASLLPSVPLAGRTLTVDVTVLVSALVATAGVGLLFGLAPALAARRVDLRSALAQGSRAGESRRRAWGRRILLGGELAATLALLVLASGLARTLVAMWQADLGFSPDRVVVAKTSLQGQAFADVSRVVPFVDQALERIRRVPGVVSASVANNVPVEPGLNMPLEPPAGSRVTSNRSVDWRYVTPDYFDTLGIALKQGRVFDEGDREGGAPVVVINEAFVRTYFEHPDVIGQSLSLVPQTEDPARTIVGVVASVKGRSGAGWTSGISALGADAPPTIYVPLAQVPVPVLSIASRFFPTTWIVRTNSASPDLPRMVQEAVRSAEPSIAFARVVPMNDLLADDARQHRVLASAASVAGLVALLIACTGVYGLVAYAASQRMREMAIRLTLGASRGAVVGLSVREAMVSALAGVVAGGLLTVALSRVARAVIGASLLEVPTLALAAVVLATALGVAAAVPAVKASRINPARALRAE